jgi:hypothetical protein
MMAAAAVGSIVLAVVACFSLGSPSYATKAEIAASVGRCVPSKGAIDPCLEEAKTLYDYDVRASSLDEVDWRKALLGCIPVSGVRACVEDFASHRVTDEGVVTSADVAAICVGAENRTDCLLALANKGYPFNELEIASDQHTSEAESAPSK